MGVRVGTIVIPPGLSGVDLRAYLEAQGRVFTGKKHGSWERSREKGARIRMRKNLDAKLAGAPLVTKP